MTLIGFLFPKLRTPNTWLDKFLESLVSEDPLKITWNTVPNANEIFITAPLS